MPYPMRARDHMTRALCTIECDASLSQASMSMIARAVDAAVVVDDAELAGLITERDVRIARELTGATRSLRLRDIPLRDVYLTTLDAPLVQIARAMTQQRFDYALVQEQGQWVGLLSLQDAVAALVDIAGGHAPSAEADAPTDSSLVDLRELLLLEHANVRRLLRRVEHIARRILATPIPHDSDLSEAFELGGTLCEAMSSELDLEDHLLAPVLETLDAWGKLRAQRLRADHAQQKLVLQSYLRTLERLAASDRAGQVIVSLLQQLVDGLREHLRSEEEHVLTPDVLSELANAGSVESG